MGRHFGHLATLPCMFTEDKVSFDLGLCLFYFFLSVQFIHVLTSLSSTASSSSEVLLSVPEVGG